MATEQVGVQFSQLHNTTTVIVVRLGRGIVRRCFMSSVYR